MKKERSYGKTETEILNLHSFRVFGSLTSALMMKKINENGLVFVRKGI